MSVHMSANMSMYMSTHMSIREPVHRTTVPPTIKTEDVTIDFRRSTVGDDTVDVTQVP